MTWTHSNLEPAMCAPSFPHLYWIMFILSCVSGRHRLEQCKLCNIVSLCLVVWDLLGDGGEGGPVRGGGQLSSARLTRSNLGGECRKTVRRVSDHTDARRPVSDCPSGSLILRTGSSSSSTTTVMERGRIRAPNTWHGMSHCLYSSHTESSIRINKNTRSAWLSRWRISCK